MQAWACLRRVYNKRDSIVSKSNLVEHCPWNLFFSSRSRTSYRGIARYNTEFLSYITRLNNKRLIDREDFWKRRERERDSENCKLNESRWKRTFKKKTLQPYHWNFGKPAIHFLQKGSLHSVFNSNREPVYINPWYT